MYAKGNFLDKFHNRLLQSIIDHNYVIEDAVVQTSNDKEKSVTVQTSNDPEYVVQTSNDQKYVVQTNTRNVPKYIPIPNLPELGSLDLSKIAKSKYFIN